jgi:ubiquitin thioesterase OTU1
MRTRLRGPGGALTIILADDATVADLIAQVIEKTSITKFDLSYGYPPKPLLLEQYENSRPLRDLGVKLDGEQLIINRKEEPVVPKEPTPKNHQIHQNDSVATDTHRVPPTTGSFSFADTASLPTADSKGKESGPIALQKKAMAGDVPELPMPERGSTLGKEVTQSKIHKLILPLVLRVMPDDNSCLFRAFATAFIRTGDDMSMPELRSIVAGAIQQDSEKYTTVVLEKKPDDYCRWIQTPDAWGGDIEMGILAKHFEVEICSIDVQVCLSSS